MTFTLSSLLYIHLYHPSPVSESKSRHPAWNFYSSALHSQLSLGPQSTWMRLMELLPCISPWPGLLPATSSLWSWHFYVPIADEGAERLSIWLVVEDIVYFLLRKDKRHSCVTCHCLMESSECPQYLWSPKDTWILTDEQRKPVAREDMKFDQSLWRSSGIRSEPSSPASHLMLYNPMDSDSGPLTSQARAQGLQIVTYVKSVLHFITADSGRFLRTAGSCP